jgi:cysteine-rich repeat protein
VLDPGEECDDWNRLDGDGCDWLCRLGDGEPPLEPDPDVPDYVPAEDDVPLTDSTMLSSEVERIPLAWTGSEFATAWIQHSDTDPGLIRFWRFDDTGSRIDAEWAMPTVQSYGGLEVVWTGTGFGLFYSDTESGLWYLRLDAQGKPAGDPVLVEPDTRLRAPAADVARDGTLVVSWVREGSGISGWSLCADDGYPDLIRVRRIDVNGGLLGPVYTVDETAEGPPDIAVGDGGVGLVYPDQVDHEHGFCPLRFARLDETLGSAVSSGVLGPGGWGDVKWLAAESKWVTSWAITLRPPDPVQGEIRVAFFSADGSLAGPPIRNILLEAGELDRPVRIAAGDGGLSLVTAWDLHPQHLSYLRTDLHGVAVSSLRPVFSTGTDWDHFGAYNTVWTDEGFAVLFVLGWPGELRLRHFVRAE